MWKVFILFKTSCKNIFPSDLPADLGMDEDDEDPVPLPNVNAAILKKVITIFAF